MGVFKGLFLAVYASNRPIRVLFLPLLYLLLSSPFLLIVTRYYKLDAQVLALLVENRSATDILLQLFVTVIAFTLPTRILSGRGWNAANNEGKRRVPTLPYWIPAARHWWNIVFGVEGWLKAAWYAQLHQHVCLSKD